VTRRGVVEGSERANRSQPAVPEDFLAAAGAVLAEAVGLRLDPALRGRLGRAVNDAAAERGQEPGEFVSTLRTEPAALQALLDGVTVQETSFFRDPAQFACFAEHVLPQQTDPVTVWSAGCANGQEPYSVAMTLSAAGRRGWRVLASDVSTRALERTGMARYTERELRGLPAGHRERFMERSGSHWQVSAELREGVTVTHHNLVTDPPPFGPGSCSVVFCRNVLIYFAPEQTAAFLNRLHRWLPVDGYVFLGFSESLWTITDRFEPHRIGDAFVYRPRGRLMPSRTLRAAPQRTAVPRANGSPLRPPALPDPKGLMSAGHEALEGGDAQAAIIAFRQAAYLDPNDALAHLQLGLALEYERHHGAALRAFAASRAALDRAGTERVAGGLEGFDVSVLIGLLNAKLGVST
jgi:chemotaxis protein methyltransferase CheR